MFITLNQRVAQSLNLYTGESVEQIFLENESKW